MLVTMLRSVFPRLLSAAAAPFRVPAMVVALAFVQIALPVAILATGSHQAWADDDDDDDDDRPRRRVIIEQRQQPVTPRREARRPARTALEFVAYLPTGTSPVILQQAGFVITGRRAVGALGRDLVRLRSIRRESTEAALRRLRAITPVGLADRNRIYRPSRFDCSAAGCGAFAMIDWPNPPTTCPVEATIGMIDTAVDAAHPAFRQGAVEVLTVRAPDRGPSSDRHGTAVAALLVGQADSEHPGLLPRARLVSVDVFHRGGDGRDVTDTFDLVGGLDALMARGIRIANLSLSGPDSPLLREAVEAAIGRGMVLVAAAGNEGPAARPLYPAAYAGVIAVTAVDRDGRVFRRANRGNHIAFAAPGVNLVLAETRGRARPQSGTSFAAPFVTAAASLVTRSGAAGVDAVVDALRKAATDIGAPGRDPLTGWGLIRRPAACTS
ncbi:S8 family serine peptidase [Phreatobacter sp.]|uniref:S8 family serine peptidase n=1 Tax=Phreatobacter sp. TaxID=1966341 RepID=UPI0025CC76D2|nr:S8 family serine peptidase [Phreatobacter sp.]